MPKDIRPNNFDYNKKSNNEILKIFSANSTSDSDRIKTLKEKAKTLLNLVSGIFSYFKTANDLINKKKTEISNKKSGLSIFAKLKGKDKEEVDKLLEDIKRLKSIEDVLKKFMYSEKNKKVEKYEDCYLYKKIYDWSKNIYQQNIKTGEIVFNKPFKSSHNKLFNLELSNDNNDLKNFVNELKNVYSIIDRKKIDSDNAFKEIASKKFENLFAIVKKAYYDSNEYNFGKFDDWVKNGIDGKKWDKIFNDNGDEEERTKDEKEELVAIYIKNTLIGEYLFNFFNEEQSRIKKHKQLKSIVLSLQCIAFIVLKLAVVSEDYNWVEKIFGVPDDEKYYQNINKNFKSLDPNTKWNRFKNMLTNMFDGRTKEEIQMKEEVMNIYKNAKEFMKPLTDMDLGRIIQEEDGEKLLGGLGKNNENLGKKIIKLENYFHKYCQSKLEEKHSVPEGWKDRIEARLVAVKLLVSEAYREFKRKIKEAQDKFLSDFGLAGNVEGFNPLDCVFYKRLVENFALGEVGMCICLNNKSDLVLKVLNGFLGKLSDINIGARIPSVKLGSLDPKKLTIRRVQPLTIRLDNKLFALRNDLNVGIYLIFAGASELLSLVFPENIATVANGAINLVGPNVDLETNIHVIKHKDKK